jgi:hypothetical protein
MKKRFTHAPFLKHVGIDMIGVMTDTTSNEGPVLMQGQVCL